MATESSKEKATRAARFQRRYPNVALLIETSRSYGRNILRGINDYTRIYGPWLFHLPNDIPVHGVPDADEWQGDGIIAQPRQDAEFIRQLVNSGVPVVSLSGPPGSGGLPAVRANQDAIAELAMAHFRDRGFARLAYCGTPSEWDWPPTGRVFQKLAKDAGFECSIYEPMKDPGIRTLQMAHLAKWLKSIKKPVGVLCQNDMRAREVLDACRSARLFVPEEVAVLGVNDDELICEMANPPLSSVAHNARRIGYEAAAMLDRLMSKKKVMADIVVDPWE